MTDQSQRSERVPTTETKAKRTRKPKEEQASDTGPVEEPKPEAAKRPSQTQQTSEQGRVVEGEVPKIELFVPEKISDADLAKLGVYQRWNRIIGEMGIIPKRGWNGHHKYWFTTDADLNAFVGPLFAKYHLVVIPTILIDKVERIELGGKQTLTRIPMQVKVINADEPDDMFTVDWVGEGADTADKGLYKGFTGGLKYFYMKLLQVATGDDPETFTRTDAIAEGRAGVNTLADESGSTGGVEVRRVTDRQQPERGGRQQPTTEAQIRNLSNLSTGMGLGVRGIAEEIDRILETNLVDTMEAIEGEEGQKAALIEFLKTRPGTDTGKVIHGLTQIAERAVRAKTEQETAAAQTEYAGAPESEEALLEQARAEQAEEDERLGAVVSEDDTPEAKAADASGATQAELDGGTS